ncbi:MAG: hypothetical protein JST45_15070 [Bacteroidetes bacterium]|nr:hypothetical protein [Bacteroidota bacterium]
MAGQLQWRRRSEREPFRKDTRSVPAGVYHVELINAGARLGVQKLVVQTPY